MRINSPIPVIDGKQIKIRDLKVGDETVVMFGDVYLKDSKTKEIQRFIVEAIDGDEVKLKPII